jgi:hypothetical protein
MQSMAFTCGARGCRLLAQMYKHTGAQVRTSGRHVVAVNEGLRAALPVQHEQDGYRLRAALAAIARGPLPAPSSRIGSVPSKYRALHISSHLLMHRCAEPT